MLIMDMLKCSVSFLEKVNIVFYRVGINQYNIDKKFNTIHAEVDAANKLPFQQKKVTVDFLVCKKNNNGTRRSWVWLLRVFACACMCADCVRCRSTSFLPCDSFHRPHICAHLSPRLPLLLHLLLYHLF